MRKMKVLRAPCAPPAGGTDDLKAAQASCVFMDAQPFTPVPQAAHPRHFRPLQSSSLTNPLPSPKTRTDLDFLW